MKRLPKRIEYLKRSNRTSQRSHKKECVTSTFPECAIAPCGHVQQVIQDELATAKVLYLTHRCECGLVAYELVGGGHLCGVVTPHELDHEEAAHG